MHQILKQQHATNDNKETCPIKGYCFFTGTNAVLFLNLYQADMLSNVSPWWADCIDLNTVHVFIKCRANSKKRKSWIKLNSSYFTLKEKSSPQQKSVMLQLLNAQIITAKLTMSFNEVTARTSIVNNWIMRKYSMVTWNNWSPSHYI